MLTEQDYKKFAQYTSFLDIRIFHDKVQRLIEFIDSLAQTIREQKMLLQAVIDAKSTLAFAKYVEHKS